MVGDPSLVLQERHMTEFPETRASLLLEVRSPESQTAWEEFVQLYRPAIYRMARKRQLQDADAQDITQNVLLKIAGAIRDYEPRQGVRFRHWLRRIAKNTILTTLSKPSLDQAAGGSEIPELLAHQPEFSEREADELEYEYRRELFQRAAAKVRQDVSPNTWQAFEKTVTESQTCETVSQSLQMPIGSVYAARSRCMKRIREQIAKMNKVYED